ncbi:MAG: 2-C-methyl-D-erythritol 4-phosphate cytidylyltransferase [Candidatus Marinimicrobia bacterium]|nr:2-C-methyl-D-erythritol 4-phosphate cytidylyltransferase [Candidatus Neomarinimicrobiota bacterium]
MLFHAKHEKISVIIPAAGLGTRIKASIPKPLLLINNKPILWYTLGRFLTNPSVAEIVLVVSPDIQEESEKLVASLRPIMPIKIIEGGKKRQDSVWNGIQAADNSATILVIHDAVRPFFAPTVIDDGIQLLNTYHGATAGVPVVHTIKRIEGKTIMETIPRESLVQIHTPQLFHASILRKVYQQAQSENFYGTDDCMLAEHYGYKLAVIPDTYENIKITLPFDLQIAKMLVKKYESTYWSRI